MGFAKLLSAQPTLLSAHGVTVEIDLTKGLHAFNVVGLPDKAVQESRDRVAAAIKNSGWKSPKQWNKKITVALAPANQKKEGPSFDLPIALAFLLAAGDIRFDGRGRMFAGELALDGSVRGIRGALGIAAFAKESGVKELYLPAENAREAALIHRIAIFPVHSLKELTDHLGGGTGKTITPVPETPFVAPKERTDGVFTDIRGQETAKRGLSIAAAGGHNIALWGPPGTGKTLLARAFTELLPPLSKDDSLEVTAIHSLAGALDDTLISEPPFRSPHHTASYVSVIGGGTIPRPGEATLAHRGVLFLDEFPEFDKRVIESLRQPLEEGFVHVSRAKGSERFPARFTLVAAMNPCPCGYFGDPKKACTCNPAAIARYRRKISGPIIDRIDLWIEVPRIDHATLAPGKREKGALAEFQHTTKRIHAAKEHQKKRFAKTAIGQNAHMSVRDLDHLVPLSEGVQKLLNESAKRLDLSARAYHRVIKLARTIADMEDSRFVSDAHILEALQYRPKRLFA